MLISIYPELTQNTIGPTIYNKNITIVNSNNKLQ